MCMCSCICSGVTSLTIEFPWYFPVSLQAFSLPLLQVVYETVRDRQEGKLTPSAAGKDRRVSVYVQMVFL